MLDSIINIFFIVVEYWRINFLDISIAIGTIGAAFGAFYAGIQAKLSAEKALEISLSIERNKHLEEKNKYLKEQINYLQCIERELKHLYFLLDNAKQRIEGLSSEINSDIKYCNGLFKKPHKKLNIIFYINNTDKLMYLENHKLVKNIISTYSYIIDSDSLITKLEDDCNNLNKTLLSDINKYRFEYSCDNEWLDSFIKETRKMHNESVLVWLTSASSYLQSNISEIKTLTDYIKNELVNLSSQVVLK